jgi:hypothetical protein
MGGTLQKRKPLFMHMEEQISKEPEPICMLCFFQPGHFFLPARQTGAAIPEGLLPAGLTAAI